MRAVWYRLPTEARTRWRAWLVLAVLIPAAVLFANLVAALPARAAARTQPAVVLRSE